MRHPHTSACTRKYSFVHARCGCSTSSAAALAFIPRFGVALQNGPRLCPFGVVRVGRSPPSRRVAGGLEDALDGGADRLRHVGAGGRRDDTLEPEVLAQARERVGKRWGWFRIPDRPPWREREPLGIQGCVEGDDGVEPEQQRRSSEDRWVRPLALRLHPEVGTGFLACGLDCPAAIEAVPDGVGVNAPALLIPAPR